MGPAAVALAQEIAAALAADSDAGKRITRGELHDIGEKALALLSALMRAAI